jgi:hypothetical protein
MISELFIENKRADISADISSLLTFAIDDVKDFSTRSTTWSKTIVIPGTSRNNSLFGNIFETGIANDYDPSLDNIGYNFNASKSARCVIFQDNIQTFKGTVRLLEIVKDKHRIEYEIALNGELTGLNVALSSGLLEDLDFSAYDHTYNETNISASWNNAGGAGYYYPHIDYGTYSTDKHNWDFRTFRPAFYVKEYIDKMFAAANFRYTCALFNTTRFKKLIVPHNQKQLTKLTGNILNATDTTTFHIINHFTGLFDNDVQFNTKIGAQFTYLETVIGGAGMTDRRFTYNGVDTIDTVLTVHLDGYYNFDIGAGLNITISIMVNGTDAYVDPSLLNANAGRDIHFNKDYSLPLTLHTGDYIEVHFKLGGSLAGGAQGNCYVTTPTLNITSNTNVANPVDYNEMIDMRYAIPKNIRQVDFLVSIVKLFNLYVYESQFDERLILMTPYVDYYTVNSADARDWTYKLNRDKPVRIKPLSELNSKIYELNYKDDTDYYNELYKKRYNQGYGSYTFDSEFEFTSQKSQLVLVFASTPLVGYAGEDKVYPTIFKRTGPDTAPVEENIDSVIRVMQSKKISTVSNWDMKNGATVLGSFVEYPYAGHLDDPDNPTNDLNFGATNELFFILATGNLSNTQFNIYWSSYMAEITDKDSKMLIANFYLTPKDIFELDFSKYIFVDGVLFRLNKITDYNVSVPSDCQVELLKVINTTYTEAIPTIGQSYLWIDSDLSYILDSDTSKMIISS